MHRIKIIFFFISLIVLVPCALILAEESISITTYYPSPYGVYNEIRLYPHSVPVTSCDSTTEGTIFYNLTAHDIQICRGAAWGGGSGFWAGSGNDIYNTNSGNVGIGKNTPSATLHILGDDPPAGNPLGTGKWFFTQGTGETEDSGKIWMQYFTGGFPLLVMSDFDDPSRIQFQQTGTGTANAPQYSSWIGLSRQNSNDISIMGGDVGIGLNNPDHNLHIKTTAPGVLAGIRLESESTSHIHFTGSTRDYSIGKYETGNDKFYIADSTAGGANRFIITPSGQVGIGGGAINPDSIFQVSTSGTASNPNWAEMRLQATTNGGGADIHFETPNYDGWSIGQDDVDNRFRIEDEDLNERLVITSAGNIGIGTLDPRYKLDVIGNIRATGSVYYGGTAGAANGNLYNKPDYVFKSGYKLRTIEEVEEYLKTQGHLPWMTSVEQEKKENGDAVDITRMGFETVETTENLQLQIITLNNFIKELQKQINDLKTQIKELQGK